MGVKLRSTSGSHATKGFHNWSAVDDHSRPGCWHALQVGAHAPYPRPHPSIRCHAISTPPQGVGPPWGQSPSRGASCPLRSLAHPGP